MVRFQNHAAHLSVTINIKLCMSYTTSAYTTNMPIMKVSVYTYIVLNVRFRIMGDKQLADFKLTISRSMMKSCPP